MATVSVIVPIYNAAEYLEKCLDKISLLGYDIYTVKMGETGVLCR